MKKILSLMAVILFAATLSACGKKAEEPVKTDTVTPPVVTEPAEAEDTGVISSIKDALLGGSVLKCDYTDEEDGTTSTIHMKGNMVLIESVIQGGTQVETKVTGLVRDNKMYVWSGESTDGIMIDFSQIKPEDETMKMGETQIHSSDDVVNEIEQKKTNCVKESLPDTAFDIPTTINWVNNMGF